MEAKPTIDEYTVQECAVRLGVGQKWLFDWLKANGHLTKYHSEYLTPTGHAAASGYITVKEGQHYRAGIGLSKHYRPVITAEGFRWLVQEVAKAKLEERKEQNEKGGITPS